MSRYSLILCLCAALLCPAFSSPASPSTSPGAVSTEASKPVPHALQAPDAPEAVTLYPAGARVFVKQRVQVEHGGIRLSLPPGVQADSVALHVEGRTVRALSLSPVESMDSPEIKRLRAAFEAARDTWRRLEGELAAVRSRQALWTKAETRFTQAGDVERMDQLMSEKLPALHLSGAALGDQLQLAQAEYQRLEQAMEQAGALDTEALLLSAQVNPAESGAVLATLTYSLNRCGWRPVYRLEAMPGADKAQSAASGEQGHVRFVQEAEIWQGSGQDWNKVRLTLAMGDPGSGLEPAPNQPWRIQPRPKVAPRAAEFKVMAPMAAAPIAQERNQDDAISSREQAVYTAWDLGSRDLPAGRATRLVLAEENWPAVFTRLIRPAVDPRAYLLAKVTLPEPRALPRGTAVYVVEGEIVGSSPFSLAGDEADVHFGVDPRVSAKMTLDARQSGKKGFVDRRQTRVWSWTIEVKNAHKQPVAVRLEDAEPQSGDTSIVIEAVSTPAPQIKDHLYVWTLSLPAGASQTLTRRISVSAPQDMELREGR